MSSLAPPPSFDPAIQAALIAACARPDLREIERLLYLGGDPSAGLEQAGNGMQWPATAALAVIARGEVTARVARAQALRVLQLLHQHDANFELCERALVLTAIRLEAEPCLLFAIEHGARLSRFGREALTSAVLGRHYAALDILRLHGIDPNLRDGWGGTALLDLCSEPAALARDPLWRQERQHELWHVQQLLELMQRGVDLDATDRIGATPLMRALAAGLPALAQALLRCGANAQALLRSGVSTLHLAAVCGNQDLLRFMVACGLPFTDLQRLRSRRLQPDLRAYLQRTLATAS